MPEYGFILIVPVDYVPALGPNNVALRSAVTIVILVMDSSVLSIDIARMALSLLIC